VTAYASFATMLVWDFGKTPSCAIMTTILVGMHFMKTVNIITATAHLRPARRRQPLVVALNTGLPMATLDGILAKACTAIGLPVEAP
jgi:hypothetical protein